MQTLQAIRCPNCGNFAEQYQFLGRQKVQIQCPICDYFIIKCSRTGNVLEAHVTGIYARSR